MDRSREEQREDFLADAFTLLHEKEQDVKSARKDVNRMLEVAKKRADVEVADAESARAKVQKDLDCAHSKTREVKAKLESALARIDELEADHHVCRYVHWFQVEGLVQFEGLGFMGGKQREGLSLPHMSIRAEGASCLDQANKQETRKVGS